MARGQGKKHGRNKRAQRRAQQRDQAARRARAKYHNTVRDVHRNAQTPFWEHDDIAFALKILAIILALCVACAIGYLCYLNWDVVLKFLEGFVSHGPAVLLNILSVTATVIVAFATALGIITGGGYVIGLVLVALFGWYQWAMLAGNEPQSLSDYINGFTTTLLRPLAEVFYQLQGPRPEALSEVSMSKYGQWMSAELKNNDEGAGVGKGLDQASVEPMTQKQQGPGFRGWLLYGSTYCQDRKNALDNETSVEESAPTL